MHEQGTMLPAINFKQTKNDPQLHLMTLYPSRNPYETFSPKQLIEIQGNVLDKPPSGLIRKSKMINWKPSVQVSAGALKYCRTNTNRLDMQMTIV